jgi:dihydrofolate reductase
MSKLVVGAFISLDGVVQAPGAPNEDTEGGFANGGWTVPLFAYQLGQIMTELTGRSSALLLGRKTYEGFAASWPLVGDDDPIAAKLNSMPKYVASTTLTTAEWANTTILSGEVADEVAKIKDQLGGEIHVSGSSDLVQTLLRHDLVDELVLLVFPVLVGPGGKRLFGEGTLPGSFELAASITTGTGVIVSTYRRSGPLEVGAVGPEQEGNG